MFLLALLLAGYPSALSCAIEIRTPAHGRGWGIPITPTSFVTVAHLVSEVTRQIEWKGEKDQHGTAHLFWVDAQKDLAIFAKDEGPKFGCYLPRATREPELQERLCWRAYLAGLVPTVVCGAYLGVDGESDMALDGWTHPGSSGAPVVDSRGQLVGVISKSSNWSANGAIREVEGLTPVEQQLLTFSMFRALSFAAPLYGKRAPWEGK